MSLKLEKFKAIQIICQMSAEKESNRNITKIGVHILSIGSIIASESDEYRILLQFYIFSSFII